MNKRNKTTVNLSNFNLEVGDKVIINDRKMNEHTRKGEIVGIEKNLEAKLYLVYLNPVKSPKKEAKTKLFLKNQLRKDEAQ